MSASRRKGTSAESAVVAYLRGHGWPLAERRAPSGARDRGDVAGVPGVVVEVKDRARLDLAGWVDEAGAERGHAGARLAVVWHKRRGRGSPAGWYVTMIGATFVELLAGWDDRGRAVDPMRQPDPMHPGVGQARRVGDDGQVGRAELAEVAAGLRAVLDLVAEGIVTAGSGLVVRLEGAVAALDALDGEGAAEGRRSRLPLGSGVDVVRQPTGDDAT